MKEIDISHFSSPKQWYLVRLENNNLRIITHCCLGKPISENLLKLLNHSLSKWRVSYRLSSFVIGLEMKQKTIRDDVKCQCVSQFGPNLDCGMSRSVWEWDHSDWIMVDIVQIRKDAQTTIDRINEEHPK